MEEQSSYVVQAMALGLTAGYQRIAFHSLTDRDTGDELWGLVRNDGTMRPSFVAYQTATRYLSGAERVAFVGRERAAWPWPAGGYLPNWQVYLVVVERGPALPRRPARAGSDAYARAPLPAPWTGDPPPAQPRAEGRQRVSVLWNGDPTPVQVSLPRLAERPSCWTSTAPQPLEPDSDRWRLTLAGATALSPLDPEGYYYVGGDPCSWWRTASRRGAPVPPRTSSPDGIPGICPLHTCPCTCPCELSHIADVPGRGITQASGLVSAAHRPSLPAVRAAHRLRRHRRGRPSTRCHAAIAVQVAPERVLLLDTAGGFEVVAGLQRADVPLGAVTRIFLSHRHSDHLLGLEPLLLHIGLQAVWSGRPAPAVHVYRAPAVLEAARTLLDVVASYAVQFIEDGGGRVAWCKLHVGRSVELWPDAHLTPFLADHIPDDGTNLGCAVDLRPAARAGGAPGLQRGLPSHRRLASGRPRLTS